MSGLEVGAAVEGLKGLREAAEFISAEMRAARERRSDDVELLHTYAQAALTAIGALEREYDEILNEALVLDLQDKSKLDALRQRIDIYLTRDIVRPFLVQAIAGLDALSGSLIEQTGAFFARRRLDRHDAVSKLRETLQELKGYFQSLEIMAPGRGRNISAVGIHHLLQLDAFLDGVRTKQGPSIATEDSRELVELIRTFRRDRSKNGMLDFFQSLERSYVKIRQAYR